uniref:Fibronectin type-III domain-containing protein n=1 Tax=Mesocestoides corti TaxID=53468 RepID=A0A5K3G1Y1_MESCO
MLFAAPKGVSVVTISTSAIKVTVQPPDDPSNIDKYNFIVKGNDKTKSCVVDAKPGPLECTFDGLSAGINHTVVACSWNAAGQICSDSVASFGWTKPTAPAVVTVTSVSTTSVVVRVEKPTDATGIGRYEVRVDGVGTTPACTIPSGDKLECQVDGLRPGTAYKVAVSSCISGTVPAVCSEDTRASGWTRPNAPKGVNVVTLSTSSIKATVQAPDNPSSISQYNITVRANDKTKSCVVDAETGPMECTFDGLLAGTKYTVVACSWNAAGQICSDSVESFGWTKPNAPADVAVVPSSSTSVAVRFKAPTDATGIGRYEVTVSGVELIKSCTIPLGEELECRVDGLQSASKFEGTVKSCINDTDPAVCSEDVVASGWTKPNPPKAATVTPLSAFSIKVTLTPPDDTRGIQHYKVSVKNAQPARSCEVDVNSATMECKITGLSAGTEYTVQACSWFEAGQVCSDAVEGRGWTKPKGPKGVKATPLSTSSIKATISPPDQPTNINQYNISVKDGDVATSCEAVAGADPPECTVRGLSTGTKYRLAVCSWSASGQICSDVVEAVGWTMPNAPAEMLILPSSSSSVFVRVTPPSEPTGIRLYTASVVGVNETSLCVMLNMENPGCRLDGLQSATEYNVSGNACVSTADPMVCSESVTASGWTKPNSPEKIDAIPLTNSSIKLAVVPPDDTNGIHQYNISLNDTNLHLTCEIEKGKDPLECVFNGLAAGTKYVVDACSWMPSVHICSDFVQTTGWTKPNAPSNMTLGSVDSTSIYVSWQKPEGMMNGITLYKALARQSSRAVE